MERIEIAVQIITSKLRILVTQYGEFDLSEVFGIQYKGDHLVLIYKELPKKVIFYKEIIEIV